MAKAKIAKNIFGGLTDDIVKLAGKNADEAIDIGTKRLSSANETLSKLGKGNIDEFNKVVKGDLKLHGNSNSYKELSSIYNSEGGSAAAKKLNEYASIDNPLERIKKAYTQGPPKPKKDVSPKDIRQKGNIMTDGEIREVLDSLDDKPSRKPQKKLNINDEPIKSRQKNKTAWSKNDRSRKYGNAGKSQYDSPIGPGRADNPKDALDFADKEMRAQSKKLTLDGSKKTIEADLNRLRNTMSGQSEEEIRRAYFSKRNEVRDMLKKTESRGGLSLDSRKTRGATNSLTQKREFDKEVFDEVKKLGNNKKTKRITSKGKSDTFIDDISKTVNGKTGKYMIDKNAPVYNEMEKAIAGGDPEKLKNTASALGLKGDAVDDFLNASSKEQMESAKNWFRDSVNNPTLMNKMGAHKAPQKAAAIGTTAWLVSNMSASKGQQSNAQLYGQQTPYGGGY